MLRLVMLCVVMIFTACSNGDNDLVLSELTPTGGDNVTSDPGPAISEGSRYSMANGCFAVKATGLNAYVQRRAEGGYGASATQLQAAEPFYLKPSTLGQYLFYTSDGQFMASYGGAIADAATASPQADWVVDGSVQEGFSLQLGEEFLAASDSGNLVLGIEAATFLFEATTGCKTFPEISINAEGKSFSGRNADGTVLGFADTHNHITGLMGFGGVYGYGEPFHPYGVEHALENCEENHGPNGLLAIEGNFVETGTPFGPHDTVGWPTFANWPAWNSAAHQHLYYKWIERGWLAGLRLMVSHSQDNEVLCRLQRQAPVECNEMLNVKEQIKVLYAMEDYIDAQEGGPGEGWFRIVTDSQQARSVIEDGKLAVIIGIEASNMFDCSVFFPVPGVEQRGCTEESFTAQMNEFYDLGVRALFPMHEFNNALGGSAIFGGTQGDILNAGNKVQTNEFWRTYQCPDEEYFYGAGSHLTGAPLPDNPLNEFIQGPLPSYDSSYSHCNQRSITDLGTFAINALMDKKMIIEVDHMEYRMKSEVLDLAEQHNPPYPLVSGHGGHGGIDLEQARRIFALGGVISGYQASAEVHVNPQLEKFRAPFDEAAATTPGLFFGKGYGQDANGLSTLAQPRNKGAEGIQYPFTLFSGPGWGDEFAMVEAVTFEQQVSGEKAFNMDETGMAHYGLIADWVEEVRLVGGEEAIEALYDSAEAYLQMWERVEGRR